MMTLVSEVPDSDSNSIDPAIRRLRLSACQETVGVHELLERILQHLPFKDLLRAKLVNRTFNQVIGTSKALKVALWLEPAHPQTPVMRFPLFLGLKLYAYVGGFQYSRVRARTIFGSARGCFSLKPCEVFAKVDFCRNVGPMLISQPITQRVTDRGGRTLVVRKEGIRVEDLFDCMAKAGHGSVGAPSGTMCQFGTSVASKSGYLEGCTVEEFFFKVV